MFCSPNITLTQTLVLSRKYLLRTERVVSAEAVPKGLSATHRMMPLSVVVRLFIMSVLLVWFPPSVTRNRNLPFWTMFCIPNIHEICGVGFPTAVQLNVVLCWTPSATVVTTGCGGDTILGGGPVWTKEKKACSIATYVSSINHGRTKVWRKWSN